MQWNQRVATHQPVFLLSSQGIGTLVVNPLLISNYAKLSLRKTKTDKKDAMTIARFLLDHHKEISQLSISQDNQDLRDLSRERESYPI